MMKIKNREVRVVLVRFDELKEVKSYIYLREDCVPKMHNLVVGLNGNDFYIGYVVGSYNIDVAELIEKADQFGVLKCPIEEPIYATVMTENCVKLMAYTV